ncbi:tyrosine-type recombinase/integrase [Micromonospora sp. KC207]|uniref:tyrosine-type recombinase/integrase n=1 Tax=Micromonospora sp. KC207 TaxID=2530377 RepID=UPI001FB71A80|nr:tyrosine-type recombinase/integrase [Micromonospora sp. KC207]
MKLDRLTPREVQQFLAGLWGKLAPASIARWKPRNVNRRFEQLRSGASLEWLHLHDLRHAFATFLLVQGKELRTVLKLLGHSTIRMTADTYGHVLPARARPAASAIGRVLGEEGTARGAWLYSGSRSTKESAGGPEAPPCEPRRHDLRRPAAPRFAQPAGADRCSMTSACRPVRFAGTTRLVVRDVG